MAIKEIKREWSPCQLDYVKTFLLHSEKDVKDLPKCCVGSKATVSETDNEYFCTESGWKLGSELGGGGEVVILPEMVVTVNDGQGGIMTPLSATPTEGATAKVTYNGTEYPCTVALVEEDGMNGYALGNLDVMGLSGGNPDAPFVVILIPDGMDGAYGVVMPMGGGATPVTISIVQTEGAASGGESAGGGVMTARVAASSNTKDMTLSGCDKKFSEFMAAYKAGKLIRIIAATEENGDPIEYIGNVVYHAVMGGTNTFAIAMPYATGTTTKQFLILPGDGGAAMFTSFDNN